MNKFYPPKENKLLIKFAKFILPWALKSIYKIEKIEIDINDIEKLKSLKGKRVILCPNHPTTNDPILMFYLSKLIDHNFNYLAAWDIFVETPLRGYFIQQLGAYSIIRGTIDNNSFKKTIEIIKEGKNFLVIFPEGDTCGLNDYLMPFQTGVIQLAFWALDELIKDNSQNDSNLFIIPIAIRYKYLKPMKKEIETILTNIEKKLKIYDPKLKMHDPKNNLLDFYYERLMKISEKLLNSTEKYYNLKSNTNLPFNERLQKIKEFIINKIANYLDIKFKPDMNLLDKIRLLFNTINTIVYDNANLNRNNFENEISEYERKLYQEKKQELKSFIDDLNRVWRFVAVYEGYIKEKMNDERFLEILKRIEWEVFGKEKSYGPLKAILKLGKEINLKDYYQDYKANKRKCIENLIQLLENQIKEMLNIL